MPTAAPDFTVFADDAYAVHHLDEPERPAPSLLRVAEEAGRPDRVIVFASTSKVTFAGAGLAFAAMSRANVEYWSTLFSAQSIGPNKGEQWRDVRFRRARLETLRRPLANARSRRPGRSALRAHPPPRRRRTARGEGARARPHAHARKVPGLRLPDAVSPSRG